MAGRPCSVDACGKTAKQRGWCYMHYSRWHRHGDPLAEPERPRIPGRACSAGGCSRPYRRNGFCSMHDQARKAAERPPKRWCRGCGAMLAPGASQGRRYCSEACRPAPPSLPAEWKPCERCGLPIDMTVRGSDGRKRRSDIKMCVYCQKAKYRRHKQSLGLVIARDGWGCKLCGEHVNGDLTAPNPASPSADHVIPFSLGGTHDVENLQLAHLLCNQIKNNKVSAPTV